MSDRPIYEIGITRSSEHNTDVQLNFSVSDKHFCLDLLTANFEPSPKLLKEYLHHVERSDPTYIPPELPEDSDEDEFVDPLEQFYDWATEPLSALFCEIPPLDRSQLYTLQDCLYTKHFVYTLKAVGDELIPVKRDKNPDEFIVGALPPASEHLDKFALPIYRPTDIHVPLTDDATALPPYPSKAYIKGNEPCFFKRVGLGDAHPTVKELSA
jgi:hypothetical protein